MKRIDFINRLIGLGGLAFLAGKSIETRDYHKFYLLQSFVRGFRHYEGPALIGQMKEGDMLELVREPDNEFDPAAVALHWNNHKIGFIPAEENELLSKLLDIKVPEFMAEIVFLQPAASTWENVRIAIYVLKEIPSSEQIPSTAAYLTQLETPHYRTLKRSDEKLTRVYIDKSTEEAEMSTDTAMEWFNIHSHSERVKKLIDTHLDPSIDYSAQADFLVVNKKRLGKSPTLAEQLKLIESELYNADAMFDEDGYIVLSVKKSENYVDRITNMVDVTDKLGRHFLELRF